MFWAHLGSGPPTPISLVLWGPLSGSITLAIWGPLSVLGPFEAVNINLLEYGYVGIRNLDNQPVRRSNPLFPMSRQLRSRMVPARDSPVERRTRARNIFANLPNVPRETTARKPTRWLSPHRTTLCFSIPIQEARTARTGLFCTPQPLRGPTAVPTPDLKSVHSYATGKQRRLEVQHG